MKAFRIIQKLTQNEYQANDGVFTIDTLDDVKERLETLFGKDFEIVFDLLNILNIDHGHERKFFYVYNERLSNADANIDTILSVGGSSLVYLYEID